MGKVIASASMSLDGCIAKDDNTIGRLFDWLQNGEVAFPTRTGSGEMTFHLGRVSATYWREWTSQLGALVCGRTLFDVTDGWGGRHNFGVPVVVVTHEVPTGWVDAHPDAPFHFVTDGVGPAVALAQQLAGDGVVAVAAGTIAGQCLELGLLDEVAVDLVPVVMGQGRKFFGAMSLQDVELGDPTVCLQGDRVTHLVFPVGDRPSDGAGADQGRGASGRKRRQPEAAPPVVGRDEFDAALSAHVAREKEVTRLNDRVSAARRRLPMVEVADHTFTGPDGPIALTDLFQGHYLLLVQNVMFDPGWEDGCPSCSWAVDNLPAGMDRLDDEAVAFAMISQAPIEKLERWRARRGWPHLWVSSAGTSYHHDWGWTRTDDAGQEHQVPGYSFYLLKDGRPYLTSMTTARGVEALLPVAQITDRTCYGRQQDWEDSPPGWPQYPTYG